MSGFCDFCNIWHSGSCCHPGRAQLAQLQTRLETAEAKVAMAYAERDEILEYGRETRAQLDAAIAQARKEAVQRCAEICLAERVAEDSFEEGDIAYNVACDNILYVIRKEFNL